MSRPKHGAAGGPGCGSCCLRAEGLGVKVGERYLLRDVSLHLHCGEITALIGPNGAGKTTLFRTLLGQTEHVGSLRFENAGGDTMRPAIGYVPQSPTFDSGDPLSVFDLYIAATSDWPVFLPPPKQLRQRAERCLARTHTQELMDSRVGRLSGGELQRVLLALALEPLPNLLILDEPFSGVDMEGRVSLWAMLDEISAQYDLSILLSTHDFSMLEQHTDRVLLLDGTLLASGRPAEVLGSAAFRQAFYPGGGAG